MVTIADIEAREKELSALESQANQVISTPIPQRKFGSRVSREQQQQVVQNRERARQVLLQIASQRKELQDIRAELGQQEQQRIERERFENAARTGSTIGLGKKEARQVQEIQASRAARAEYNKSLQKLKAQGLTPVYSPTGELAGFRDEERNQTVPLNAIPNLDVATLKRYEKAGAVTLQQNVGTPLEQQQRMSLPENVKFLNPVEYAIVKGQQNERRLASINRSDTGVGLPVSSVLPPSKIPLQVSREKTIRNIKEFVRNPLAFTENAKQLNQPTLARVPANIIYPYVLTGVFIKRAATTNPIVTTKQVKDSLVQLGRDLRSGKVFKDVKQFAKEDPLGFGGRIVGEYSLFRVSQLVEIRGTSLVSTSAARFRPSFRGVSTERIIIEGIEFQEQRIKNLPKVNSIALIPEGSNFVPRSFQLPASVRGSFGFTAVEQKRFRGTVGVTTSQRGLLPRFRRTAQLTEVEEGLGLFGTPADPVTKSFQTRISRLGEAPRVAGFRDIIEGQVSFRSSRPQIIVFPSERVGRKGGFEVLTVRGQQGKLSSELEAITKPVRLGGPGQIEKVSKLGVTVVGGPFGKVVPIFEAKFSNVLDVTTTSSKQLKADLKMFNQVIDAQDLVIKNSVLEITKAELPVSSFGPPVVIRKESLTQRIKVEKVSSPPSFQRRVSNIRTTQFIRPVSNAGVSSSEVSRKISPPSLPSSILAPSSSASRPPSAPSITRSPRPPSPPRLNPPKIPPPPTRKDYSLRTRPASSGTSQTGYRSFVIRRGKKVFLKGIFPKSEAIMKGEEKAIRSLAATFGVKKTKQTVRGLNLNYQPRKSLFRSFRIKQGKRVPLVDEFIQRRGKRLSFQDEVNEIHRARRLTI